jgi:PEP-CTERM motif-containing protein
MKKTTCVLAMLGAGMVTSARASLILVSPVQLSGTGLGSVNTVLTLNSTGSATTESGCTAPSGTGTTTSGCGFTDSTVQAQFGSPSLSDLGIASAADLRIVFNASEPGSANDINLNNLVLTLYHGSNTTMTFTASLPTGVHFATTASGVGNSGYVFALASPSLCAAITGGCPIGTDTGEAAAAQAFINSNGGITGVRVGLGSMAGASIGAVTGAATGGLETFFVESQSASGGPGGNAVPEPSTLFFLGGGLLAIALPKRSAKQ